MHNIVPGAHEGRRLKGLRPTVYSSRRTMLYMYAEYMVHQKCPSMGKPEEVYELTYIHTCTLCSCLCCTLNEVL